MTGLPSLASLAPDVVAALMAGRLALWAGDPDVPSHWITLAGDHPVTGRRVWALFEYVDKADDISGVRVRFLDGPDPVGWVLPGGGFVAGAVDTFLRGIKAGLHVVRAADELRDIVLNEGP
jgi:hypothetical protein